MMPSFLPGKLCNDVVHRKGPAAVCTLNLSCSICAPSRWPRMNSSALGVRCCPDTRSERDKFLQVLVSLLPLILSAGGVAGLGSKSSACNSGRSKLLWVCGGCAASPGRWHSMATSGEQCRSRQQQGQNPGGKPPLGGIAPGGFTVDARCIIASSTPASCAAWDAPGMPLRC